MTSDFQVIVRSFSKPKLFYKGILLYFCTSIVDWLFLLSLFSSPIPLPSFQLFLLPSLLSVIYLEYF